METMNTPDPAADEPREDPARTDPAGTVSDATDATDAVAAATVAAEVHEAPEAPQVPETNGASEPAPHVPVIHQVEREVTLERGVRYGRVIIAFTIAGSIIAMMMSLLTPLADGGDYTLSQIVGFMALIGAVVGLAVGGLVSVVLGMVAKRRTGTGVAIQTDVR